MSRGILLKILATFVFTLMSVMAKLSGGRYPLTEVVFCRSFFALAVVVVWLSASGGFFAAVATDRPFGHLGRGLAGSGGMFCNFLALTLLPLPDATAIGFASPLMTVALAALLLGEPVRIYRWSAVGIGFAGVVAMLWDHLGGGTPPASSGASIALAGACFSAVATVQTRRLTLSEKTPAIVFYFTLMTTCVAGVVLLAGTFWPSGWDTGLPLARQSFVLPDGRDAAILVAIGVFGGLGQILMTESYRHADASIIACFDYTSMLWALALGIMLFGEQPSGSIVAGAAIVSASGLFVIWRERQLGLVRAASREADDPRAL